MTWNPRALRADTPIYLAIADRIAEDVAKGRLAPGARLPTHRELAERLGVDLTTVTRAYTEARRRGLLVGRVGRGTFVRADVRLTGARPFNDHGAVTDLSQNTPPRLDPDLPAQALAATLSDLTESMGAGALLQYQNNAGMDSHREAGAAWLSKRLPDVDAANVVLTNGAQHAISVLLSTLASPGDTVLTEALTYPAFRSAAEHLGLKVIGVEMDDDGMSVDAFRRACKAGGRARLLYTTPTLHNPTTISTSARRRALLARVAQEFGVRIIEDDVYGMLVDNAPLPFATHAPERTYFISSLSKSIAGGLRIGYVVCPSPNDAERVSSGVRVTTWMAPPLMAHIASHWVRSGTAREILKSNRAEAARRQAIAARILSPAVWRAERFSYHGWLELPKGWSTSEFVAQARRASVAVTPGDAFAVSGRCDPPGVRLSVTAPHDRDALADALSRIARLLEFGPRASERVL